MTVKPDQDTKERLKDFKNLFGPKLVVLTGKSNTDPALVDMMRKFKVPVGLSESEMASATLFFESQNQKKWYQFWKRKPKMPTLSSENNHS